MLGMIVGLCGQRMCARVCCTLCVMVLCHSLLLPSPPPPPPPPSLCLMAVWSLLLVLIHIVTRRAQYLPPGRTGVPTAGKDRSVPTTGEDHTCLHPGRTECTCCRGGQSICCRGGVSVPATREDMQRVAAAREES